MIVFDSHDTRESFLKQVLRHQAVKDKQNPLSQYKWVRGRTDVESLRISDWIDAERAIGKHEHTTKQKAKPESLFKNKDGTQDRVRRVKVGDVLAYSQGPGQIAGASHSPSQLSEKKDRGPMGPHRVRWGKGAFKQQE